MAYDSIDEDAVYTCVGHPLRRDIENIVYWVLNENFTTAYNSILYKYKFDYLDKFQEITLWFGVSKCSIFYVCYSMISNIQNEL